MIKRILLAGTISFFSLTSEAQAQGVPTIDGTQLAQLLAQLEHMASDLNVQLEQVATMRQELETQVSQLTNLDAQLKSLIDGNEIGQLLATEPDRVYRRRFSFYSATRVTVFRLS
jgi:type IV secretion system protein VirB5